MRRLAVRGGKAGGGFFRRWEIKIYSYADGTNSVGGERDGKEGSRELLR